jgi:gluconate 2-dehydrogenase gamma chain
VTSPRFLTPDQARLLGAVADRIFPPSAACPSATELGAVAYVDRQLDGPWGRGERMYRQPPFRPSADPLHGWQSPMTPAEAYTYGLAALQRHARRAYGADFADLSEAQQDAALTAVEHDRSATFEDFRAGAWFALVRTSVVEGVFADPQHGGNAGRQAWAWLGFPGDPTAAAGGAR